MNHTIQNEHLTVTAAARGAELQSILGADGTEYLWQGDPRYWSDRALNIFPCVARLTNGSYYLDGQLYHMDIHGIAPYRDFRLAENTGERMTLELAADEETLQSYPRRFVFRVTYALQGGTLAVTYEVENRDERTMYFGLGGHPGFRVPLAEGASFEDYRLRFSSPCEPKAGRFYRRLLPGRDGDPLPPGKRPGTSPCGMSCSTGMPSCCGTWTGPSPWRPAGTAGASPSPSRGWTMWASGTSPKPTPPMCASSPGAPCPPSRMWSP